MTTATERLPAPKGGLRSSFSDALVITGRNLRRIPRIPELAIFAILQSIMFVLLFAFVFGGAILIPGNPNPNAYREYLMPGIFAQTIVFAAATMTGHAGHTAHALPHDLLVGVPRSRAPGSA